MSARALDGGSWGEVAWLAGAVALSLFLHGSLAAGVSSIPERPREDPVWVEMAIATVEPEPEPVPEPEPEPEPPPEPEVVDFEPPQPQPETPPPEAKPPPKPIGGLSNDSFLPGSGSGIPVPRGNTLNVKPTGESLPPGDAEPFQTLPFASVTTPPKVRFKPTLEVPESVKAAGLQGRVELLLTIDAEGKVGAIAVAASLSPDADAACKAAIAKSRWKPGEKDGVPVVTRGVPYSCRFEQSAN